MVDFYGFHVAINTPVPWILWGCNHPRYPVLWDWNIQLHERPKLMGHVGKYSSHMEHMGIPKDDHLNKGQ